jgi:DNA-binding Lrp family transcriptional regulator
MYAYVLVEVPGGSPLDLERKIAKFKGVIESRSVYGSHYDIVVRVETENQEECDKVVDAIQLLEKGVYTVTLQAKVGKAPNV